MPDPKVLEEMPMDTNSAPVILEEMPMDAASPAIPAQPPPDMTQREMLQTAAPAIAAAGGINPMAAQWAANNIPLSASEAKDMLLNHTPEIAAGLATLPIGGIGGFGGVAARVAVAGLAGAAGKLLTNEAKMTEPGNTMTLGEALKSAFGEGAKQGAFTAFGEGVTAGVKYIPQGIVKMAQATPAGRAMLNTIGAGVRKEANATAQQMADQILAVTPEAAAGGMTKEAGRNFERLAWEKSNSLASSVAVGSTGHTLGAEGSMEIANLVKGAFSKDEMLRSGNFMESLGAIDRKAIDTWIKAGEGNKETYEIIEAITGVAKSGKMKDPKAVVAMLENLDPNGIHHYIRTNAPVNAEIPVALAINFRKAVSQLSADSSAPQALQRVAAAIQGEGGKRLERLDTLITKSLPPEEAAKYLAYLQFSSFRGEILENAAYLAMKDNPGKVIDAIGPQQPDMAKAVRSVSEYLVDNGKRDILPMVQRNWLEKQLQEKGVEGFTDVTKAYGPEVLKELFPRGKGADALLKLNDLSQTVTKRLSDVGIKSEFDRETWGALWQKAGTHALASAGGAIGSVLSPPGAGSRAAGGAAGVAASVAIPAMIVAMTRGDKEAIQTLKGLANFATNSPAVNDIIARRLGNWIVESQKDGPVANQIAAAMRTAHVTK